MKRIGFIFEKITDIENIKLAIYKASKGKRKRNDVVKILNNIDFYALEVKKMLEDNTFEPSDYKIETIKEGILKKERVIYKPNFYPDQVVQWAIILQIEGILKKGMSEFTCGSVPKRGVHYGKRFVEKWIRKDRKHTKYCMKLDITKFYPSVNNKILVDMLKTKIKDKKVIFLIEKIIYKNEGLPIGILFSQWFANFYLQELDHLIKEKFGVKYYIRYMDDMVLFGNNKKKLHKIRKLISDYLEILNLKLKGNWQIFKFDSRGLDFLGFRFFREKTILRRSVMLRITRKVKRVSKKDKATVSDAQSILSYMGWVKHSDSRNLYINYIDKYVKIKELKNIIRKESKYAI